MPKTKIRLGNEIEDVVTKVRGIAHGHVEYLDGTTHWIIQPPIDESGAKMPEVYAPAEYCSYVGEGVHATPVKRTLGFHAPEKVE